MLRSVFIPQPHSNNKEKLISYLLTANCGGGRVGLTKIWAGKQIDVYAKNNIAYTPR